MKIFIVALCIVSGSVAAFARPDLTSQAAKKYYIHLINNTNAGGFNAVAESVGSPLHAQDLKSHARNRYLNLYRTWGQSYPPKAFLVSSKQSGLGADTVAITEDTDGGGYMYVYDVEGNPLVDCMQSESGDLQCN